MGCCLTATPLGCNIFMKVYLDSNFIIDLYDGIYPNFLDSIIKKKDEGINQFPYSTEHIQELCGTSTSNVLITYEQIEKRLNFISNLTTNLYFRNDMITTEFTETHPKVVFNTLNDLPIKFNAKDLFSNLIPYETLRNGREQLNLDPQNLNNIKPEKAIAEIDKILSNSKSHLGIECTQVDLSILGMLKKGFQSSEDAHKNASYHRITSKKESYLSENYIVMLFSLLDTLGFWADKKNVYDKGSRFADAIHCFNGSYCNYVISNDIRFCKKALSVYKYYNIDTIVYHLKENIEDINKLLQNAT